MKEIIIADKDVARALNFKRFINGILAEAGFNLSTPYETERDEAHRMTKYTQE